MRTTALALLALTLPLFTGCGAVGGTLVDLGRGRPAIMSGVRFDAELMFPSHAAGPVDPSGWLFMAFDLPVSFVIDAVLLPFTVPQSVCVGLGHVHEALIEREPSPPSGPTPADIPGDSESGRAARRPATDDGPAVGEAERTSRWNRDRPFDAPREIRTR